MTGFFVAGIDSKGARAEAAYSELRERSIESSRTDAGEPALETVIQTPADA